MVISVRVRIRVCPLRALYSRSNDSEEQQLPLKVVKRKKFMVQNEDLNIAAENVFILKG